MKPAPLARSRRPLSVAFAWGFAESTFFFLVPDVWTSRLALEDFRLALRSCIAATGGALLGGLILYGLGPTPVGRELLPSAFDWIPGISPALLDATRSAVHQQGSAAMFSGMAQGVPFKLYALHAPTGGIGLASFLVAAATARLLRFLLVTTLAWSASTTLLRRRELPSPRSIHALVWTAFYVFYFQAMGW